MDRVVDWSDRRIARSIVMLNHGLTSPWAKTLFVREIEGDRMSR